MATIRIYRCDSCGTVADTAKGLRRFDVQWGPKPTRYSGNSRAGVAIDICPVCVKGFADSLTKYIGEKGRDAINPPPKVAKVKGKP